MNPSRAVVIWCLVLLHAAGAMSAADFWVAPKGNDDGPGTAVEPFATPARALREAREFRRRDPAAAAAGVQIVLRGGAYHIVEPVFVRPEDSGTLGAPTVIMAAPGERPILSGGVMVTGWTRAGGNVPGLPPAAQAQVWSAPAPSFNGRPLLFRQLWVENRKAVRARTPNQGEMGRISSFSKATRELGVPAPFLAGLPELDGSEMFLVQIWEIAILRLRAARLEAGESRVRFHEPEQRLQFDHPWPPPLVRPEVPDGNSPFFLMNRIEFLDAPGEWHLDERGGRVYYWPREGEDLASARVAVPALETLVEVLGTPDRPVRHVRFEGVGFVETTWLRPSTHGHVPLQAGMFLRDAYKLVPRGTPDWRSLDNQGWVGRPPAAVTVTDAAAIEFEGCRFERLAASGLDFVSGVLDGRVRGSVFRDIGINGVQSGSFQTGGAETHLPYLPADPRTLVSGVRVANNVFADTANEDWGGVAIAAGFVREAAIEHNEIVGTSYTAISLGWGWTRTANAMADNRVHANRIRRFSTRLTDAAGIYTLSAQAGTVISANVIEAPEISRWAHDAQHWGFIYLDEGSAFITVNDNWSPAEKFIRNANGPGNTWGTNGPTAPAAVREGAGLQAPYRELLSEFLAGSR